MKNTIRRYEKLNDVLGIENLKVPVESPFDFITIANMGLNADAVVHFNEYFRVSWNFTADLLNLSERTLHRLSKSGNDLRRNNSVQLLEIADLFLYGIEVFESQDSFFLWLKVPNTSLGGIAPHDLIEIPGGISKIRDLLGRIEHGIYS